MTRETSTERGPIFREVGIAYALAIALCAGLYAARRLHPIFASQLALFVAIVFWFLPMRILDRAKKAPEDYGLRLRPLGRNLLIALAACAIVLPPFLVGYVVYHDVLCKAVRAWACAPFVLPWQKATLRLPPELPLFALGQIILVAAPEEFFFRGYLQGRLREVVPAWKAILVSSALFGLGHFLVDHQVSRLAVFFPGLLFGLLRERTGSIVASAIFHAACNVFIAVLGATFWR